MSLYPCYIYCILGKMLSILLNRIPEGLVVLPYLYIRLLDN